MCYIRIKTVGKIPLKHSFHTMGGCHHSNTAGEDCHQLRTAPQTLVQVSLSGWLRFGHKSVAKFKQKIKRHLFAKANVHLSSQMEGQRSGTCLSAAS